MNHPSSSLKHYEGYYCSIKKGLSLSQWIIQYAISISSYVYTLPCQDVSGKVPAIVSEYQLLIKLLGFFSEDKDGS